jgi:hypothetical protein
MVEKHCPELSQTGGSACVDGSMQDAAPQAMPAVEAHAPTPSHTPENLQEPVPDVGHWL